MEIVLGEHTVMAEALDFEELAIDLLAEVAQKGEIVDGLGRIRRFRLGARVGSP